MILLDTCTFLWLISEPNRISPFSKKIILNYINQNKGLYVSSISAFEIALKVSNKKYQLPLPGFKWFNQAIQEYGIEEIEVSSEISFIAADLKKHHNDPFDRIIIATGIFKRLKILTPDKMIRKYIKSAGVDVSW